jgi:ATP synthase I chain
MIDHEDFESRSFRMGGILVIAGTLLTGLLFGIRHGISFLAGGILSALNMGLLRHSIHSALGRAANQKFRTVGSYIVRLLLIPLGLYVIMRLFFWGIIAAITGFAVFGCGIFLEGVREAFKGSSR